MGLFAQYLSLCTKFAKIKVNLEGVSATILKVGVSTVKTFFFREKTFNFIKTEWSGYQDIAL